MIKDETDTTIIHVAVWPNFHIRQVRIKRLMTYKWEKPYLITRDLLVKTKNKTTIVMRAQGQLTTSSSPFITFDYVKLKHNI